MMGLRRLDFTRFGHLTERSLDLGPTAPGGSDFHIIFGPNESGKTTLMEAWLRLIYGFPVREPYGFKHALNMLQIGGLVEINGASTELVRVKRTVNSLLDRHGAAIPETILHACLGGIAQEDYRKLFCLDDATIEAGGEEITNSKGDFGRLLFAAAAGIGNLTGVLDQVAAQAEAFYPKGASKTTFAGLKRDLDGVVSEIKALDVSPAAYHALRTALDVVKVGETGARLAKDQLERRKSQLLALIAAHPIAADLHAAEEALAPISHYPMALDIAPESLVALMTARVMLEAARDQQAKMVAEAEASLAALVLRPDMKALRDEILALEDLSARMQGALIDLPIRVAEREAALNEMRAKLTELGFDPGTDPTRFVLPDHQLRGLERQLQEWCAAEVVRNTAITEARKATLAHQDSAAVVKAAEAAVTIGPEVGDILIRFGAAQCVDNSRTAQMCIAQAKASFAQRLRDLARGGVAFAELPAVTFSQRQAEVLATETLKVDQQILTARANCGTAAGKLAKAKAQLGVLTDSTDLVTDDLATLSRDERNSRWTRHRAALDAATADAFAEAMQRDDGTTALRQAQTREIADYHQARMAVSEAEVEMQGGGHRTD